MKRNRLALIAAAVLLCGCNGDKTAEITTAETTQTAEITEETSTITSETTVTTKAPESTETEAVLVSTPEEEKTDEQRRLESLIIAAAKEQGMYDDSFVMQNQLFGDFDGDGTEELAAVYGDRNKAFFEDLCHGAVWFSSGDSAECLAEEYDWLAPRLVSSQGKTFIKLERCYVSDSQSLYFIINNSTAEAMPLPIVQGLYPDGEYGDFTGVNSAYDMSVRIYEDSEIPISTGHTYKTCWYYLMDEDFSSYYAEEITEADFLAYEGADEQLDYIYGQGGELKSILKWGSGTVTVSWQKRNEIMDGESFTFKNIMLNYRSGKVFPVTAEYDNNGFYMNPVYSESTAFDRCMITLYDSVDAEPEDKVEHRTMVGDTLYANYCGKLWQVNGGEIALLEENAADYEDFPLYIKENYTEKPAETTTVTTTAATTVITTTEAATTTPEITTVPETKKTKKTKKITTASEETTAPETTEATTTTEPPEIIPETGIYTASDGTFYVDGKAYTLTFEDEFEGEALDLTKWEYCPEWQRQGVNCYWRNSAVSLDGTGNLCITSSYHSPSDKFIMGGIRSKDKFEQAYGFFEVRCTLNTIPGYWSAFWLLCEEVMNEDNSGVDGTEIDIMESAFFSTSGVNHALNWDGYGDAHKTVWYQTEKTGLYEGFHTFSLLWTEEEYVFYVDGVESVRTKAEEAGGISTAPSYLKFTTETGLWTMADMNKSKLPDKVYVDYIRVYQAQERITQ